MKKTALIVLLFTFSFIIKAQQAFQFCGTDEYETFLDDEDSSNITQRNLALQFMEATRQLGRSTADTAVITIPIVVHRIGNSIINSVSAIKINQQIQILNEDYGRITGSNGFGNGVDTRVRFCLANKDENNNSTSGIVNVTGTFPTWHNRASDNASNSDWALKNLSHWNPSMFLNLYIVDSITSGSFGVTGYGKYPWTNDEEKKRDGVVMDNNFFGLTTSGHYNLGHIATHEVGHWLGLFHTFEGGCTNTNPNINGDRVADTPPVTNDILVYTNNCTYRNSCHTDLPDSADLIKNYMEYSHDICRNMFTQGQADRMRTTLHTIRDFTKFKSCISSCENNVMDGLETGVDCGGPLCNPCAILTPIPPANVSGGGGTGPMLSLDVEQNGCNSWSGSNHMYDEIMTGCRTVRFKINNRETWSQVNVCATNIVLSPFNYVTNQGGTNTMWAYNIIESNKKCTNTNNMSLAARKDNRFSRCHCWWVTLGISVQECDENFNLTGTEHFEWKYFFDSNISDFTADLNTHTNFNLHQNLPSGAQLDNGKFYKVKIASFAHGVNMTGMWIEHSGFIRTYKDSLYIVNKASLTKSQFADYIEIKNSLVPDSNSTNGNNVQIVAISKIKISADNTNSTSLKNGRYYIDTTLSCNNPAQFRMTTPVTDSDNYSDSETATPSQSWSIIKKDDIRIIDNPKFENKLFPNPNKGSFAYTLNYNKGGTLIIYNLLGKEAHREELNGTENSIEFNLSHLEEGIYFFSYYDTFGGLIENKKFIISK